MAKQRLMWTALPNGIDAEGRLRVSALLSPRLEPDFDGTLNGFPDFLDWPDTLRNSRFTVIYGADSVAPAEIDATIDTADSDAWKALFPPETFVRGHKFEDLSDHVVLSYDAAAVDTLTQQLYSALARTYSDRLPRIGELLNQPEWRGVIEGVAVLDRHFTQERSGLRDIKAQFALYRENRLKLGNPVAELLGRAQLFHTPPSTPEVQDYAGAPIPADDPRRDARWRTHKRTKLPDAADFAKEIDFHQIVAAMNQYPRLLRRLGLVVDFVVPRDRFTESPDQPLTVLFEIGTGNPPGMDRISASSRTRTRFTPERFLPVPRPSFQFGEYIVRNGLLMINSDLFAVVQNDVDAAGLKIANFARTLRRVMFQPDEQLDPVTKFEKPGGAPALRNAGLMLVHRRRARLLESALATNKTKNDAIQKAFDNADNSFAPELYAEDLIRGWRIDIWDDRTKRWRSLCERTATHVIADAITLEDDREGTVRLAATKSPDPASNAKLIWLHEALLSWTGWSLVAPAPGLLVDAKDEPGDATPEVPPGIRLRNSFRVKPGTLPRLRYGRRYWVRARMADLASNSLEPSPKDLGHEKPEENAVLYQRFEPVQPPAIALVREGGQVEKPAEGESMERMAIRSFNATPPDNSIATDATARRSVVPARTNVREAELHGALDSGGSVDASQAMFDTLAAKDSALEEVKLLTGGPLADPVETYFSVVNAEAAEIPYLPDPLCIRLAARIFDHPTFPNTEIIDIPVYPAGAVWPNAAPFTIRIFEDAAAVPKFDEDARVLHIPLPKATRATLRLSSQIAKDPLAFMGVWNWLNAAERAALAPKALRGQHWMITPWRNVELVHAVQKPLIAPEMKLVLQRGFGDTTVRPRFNATCSLASTVRVDLQAAWHEPDRDPASAPSAADLERTDHAFSVKITDPRSYAMRNIDPAAAGVPEHDIAGTDRIAVNINRGGIVKLHEFGDTRYRRIEYWLEATTRFREYMPPSVLLKEDGTETDENIKVTGPAVTTWVPSSAPPPAPQVLYVVPTFGWTTHTSAQGAETRWRHGGGLRVYLDRPWYASGYGEMLAVVLPRAGFTGDPNLHPEGRPYKKFVTQWGNDPVWESPFVNGPSPKVSNFPLARNAPDAAGAWLPPFAPATEADQPPGPFLTTNLTHPSLPFGEAETVVDIAPHDVAWDPERRLWYCDIEVNFGAAYFPFIRLALARYQPVSVPNAHLSNIVLADFASLAPDRWLTVSQTADARVRNVSVHGHRYTNSAGNVEAKASPSTVVPGRPPEVPASVSPTSVIELWVEKLNPDLGEDFGWQRDSSAQVNRRVPLPRPPRPNRPPRPIGGLQHAQAIELIEGRRFDIAIREELALAQLLWPTLWDGTVTLAEPPASGERRRLVVAEYEEYLVDDDRPYFDPPTRKGRRLVFVEHVELS